MDIVALSELYNVRVGVYEYDIKDRDVFISSGQEKEFHLLFEQCDHSRTTNIPLVLLLQYGENNYNLICDPDAPHQRPLGVAKERSRHEKVSLRELRYMLVDGNILGDPDDICVD